MKFSKFYFFLLLSLSITNIQATIYTATGCPGPVFWGAFDGTCPFFNGGTRLSFQPATDDVLEIPAGCTVTVNQNFTINNNITLNIYGQLKFQGSSNALNFNGCSSQIVVYSGGSISASSSSNQIKICSGGAEWKGPGTSTGPFMITNGNLPVELLDFSGICVNNGVQLNWSTATEVDNESFLIEKSENGTEWQFVTKIPGNGTTGTTHHYIHTDFDVNINNLEYYRLSQIDKDQTKTVFKAIDINCGNNLPDQMILFSNPASTELNILLSVNDISNNNTIKVMNNVGQIVMETKINLNKGLNTFLFPIDLNPGIYHILFSSDKVDLPSQKLLIIK